MEQVQWTAGELDTLHLAVGAVREVVDVRTEINVDDEGDATHFCLFLNPSHRDNPEAIVSKVRTQYGIRYFTMYRGYDEGNFLTLRTAITSLPCFSVERIASAAGTLIRLKLAA